MSVHSTYHLRAAGMIGGEMIVMVKCGGDQCRVVVEKLIKDEIES